MKKLISFVAAAGLLLLSSCGTNKGIKGMKVVATVQSLLTGRGLQLVKKFQNGLNVLMMVITKA